MLTLQDVGIPDYDQASWNSLEPRRKLEEYFVIRDEGKAMDAPITVQDINCLGRSNQVDMSYNADSFLFELDERLPKGISYVELYEFIEEVADDFLRDSYDEKEKSRKKIHTRKVNQMVLGLMGHIPPYFSNNFFGCFPIELTGASGRRGSKKELRRLDKLLRDTSFSFPEGLSITSFEGQRLVYPYYITLKREGFKDMMA